MTVIPQPPVRPHGIIGGLKESHNERLLLSNFKTGFTGAPSGYKEWDGSHGWTSWGMDWNDQKSCCGAAAVDHGNAAKADNLQLVTTLGQPKFANMLATYYAYGIAQGEPGPDPDQGVTNDSWLGFLYQQGLISWYGEVPLDEIDLYAANSTGLLCGLLLYGDEPEPQSMIDFQNHVPWGTNNESPNPQLGHDTWLIKTHADGGLAVVTWGGIQEVTLSFRQNNITDVWAFGDQYDPTIDQAALSAELVAIHGTGKSTAA